MNNSYQKKSGYEYLLAYKIAVPIYDLTAEFCDKHISKFSRTRDQMIQAARSEQTPRSLIPLIPLIFLITRRER